MEEKIKKIEERGRKLFRGLQSVSFKAADILELAAALLVAAVIVLALFSLVPEVGALWSSGITAASFQDFLEKTLTVVIGIEFLKMLFRPTSDNVLETLIFLVARHMIVTQTTPVEDLVSTISIVLLVLVKKFLSDNKPFNIGKHDKPEASSGKEQ